MKKFSTVLCVLTIAFSSVKAQNTEWGLKAGLQLSQFRGDDFLAHPATSSSSNPEAVTSKGGMKTGYTIGLYVRTRENVFLQGEILASVKGAELERLQTGTKTSIQYGQVDIPLSIGYKMNRFEISGGPLVSFKLFDDGNLKTFLSQYSNTPLSFSPYRSYVLGYQAGIGYNLDKLSIGLRYMASIQGVSDMYIAYNIPGDTQLRDSHFFQRFSSFQLTAAYRLSK
jgi:hypothetical protein